MNNNPSATTIHFMVLPFGGNHKQSWCPQFGGDHKIMVLPFGGGYHYPKG